ncbi:MAG: hypothetical protein JSR90_00605 [Proteobacteria bacterium]|nr:hypothetical protein [Pseudomonadota bacterium]
MGMIFNTPATLEMTAMVNTQFAASNLATWRARKGDFNGALNLHQIAARYGVVPGSAQAQPRWRHWLVNILHQTACSALPAYTIPGTTPYGPGGSGSNVGKELTKLMAQALDDPNCEEIVMVIQPHTSVYIAQAETIASQSAPGRYSLAITLCTMQVPAIIPPPA